MGSSKQEVSQGFSVNKAKTKDRRTFDIRMIRDVIEDSLGIGGHSSDSESSWPMA